MGQSLQRATPPLPLRMAALGLGQELQSMTNQPCLLDLIDMADLKGTWFPAPNLLGKYLIQHSLLFFLR